MDTLPIYNNMPRRGSMFSSSSYSASEFEPLCRPRSRSVGLANEAQSLIKLPPPRPTCCITPGKSFVASLFDSPIQVLTSHPFGNLVLPTGKKGSPNICGCALKFFIIVFLCCVAALCFIGNVPDKPQPHYKSTVLTAFKIQDKTIPRRPGPNQNPEPALERLVKSPQKIIGSFQEYAEKRNSIIADGKAALFDEADLGDKAYERQIVDENNLAYSNVNAGMSSFSDDVTSSLVIKVEEDSNRITVNGAVESDESLSNTAHPLAQKDSNHNSPVESNFLTASPLNKLPPFSPPKYGQQRPLSNAASLFMPSINAAGRQEEHQRGVQGGQQRGKASHQYSIASPRIPQGPPTYTNPQHSNHKARFNGYGKTAPGVNPRLYSRAYEL